MRVFGSLSCRSWILQGFLRGCFAAVVILKCGCYLPQPPVEKSQAMCRAEPLLQLKSRY